MKRLGGSPSLLVELVVVIMGVLIALAADSWWGSRLDTQRVDSYLLAVDIDMVQADSALSRYDSILTNSVAAVGGLVDGLEGSTELPASLEPAIAALRFDSRDGVLVPTGNLDALLSTGDVNLLPPAVRQVIVRERSTIQERLDRIDLMFELLVGSFRDLDLPRQEMIVAGELGPAIEQLTPSDVAESPRMRHGWYTALTGLGNQLEEVRVLRSSVARIRAALSDHGRG